MLAGTDDDEVTSAQAAAAPTLSAPHDL